MKKDDIELPPLPEPFTYVFPNVERNSLFHTKQMQDYARAASVPYKQRIEELEAQLEAIGAGGVSSQRITSQRRGGGAKARYDEAMAGETEPDPIERLRFYCSFAMSGQDWLDVEPFFDALITDRQQRGEPVIWYAPNYFPDSPPNTWGREVVAVTNFRRVFILSCMGTYWQRPRDFAEGEYVVAWADFPDIEQQTESCPDCTPQPADPVVKDSLTVPDGWQLVPKEPTEEMLEGTESYLINPDGEPVDIVRVTKSQYRELLAAAPKFGE